jgi:DNA-binding GntR family transcriptional regulator
VSGTDTLVEIERGTSLRMGLSVQRLFDLLVDEIVTGRFPPGGKLNEPELARRFGISRGPLREAIRRLEERQLVRCTPNAGARVAVHTPEEIIEAYEIREALEGMAARLAATNMSDEERVGLRRAFEGEKTRGKSGGYQADFHMHIVRGSHNARLIRMLNEDYYRLFKLWRTSCRWLRFGGEATWNDHERILDAIEHRDAECAEILMRRHIARLRLESFAELQRLGADPAGTA